MITDSPYYGKTHLQFRDEQNLEALRGNQAIQTMLWCLMWTAFLAVIAVAITFIPIP